jgi:hypothetical protein
MKARTRGSSRRLPMRARKGQPASGQRSSFTLPYYPSWVDRFTAFVDRLPGPPWAFYLGLAVVIFLASAGVQWAEGTHPFVVIGRDDILGAVLTPYALGLMHYLDRSAVAAIRSFRPALRGGETTYQRLAYIFTTLPARLALTGTLLTSLAGLALVLAASYALSRAVSSAPFGAESLLTVLNRGYVALFGIGPSPGSYAVTTAVLLLNWWTGGTLILHTVRRLFLVARIYRRHTNVDLFRQAPLYALSRLTALTTIGSVLVVYGIATVPSYMATPFGGVTVAMIVVLSFASFALPLLGIHRALAGEKDRLLEDISDRLRSAGDELHHRIDRKAYKRMDEINKALAGLEIERNMISAIPTWPWQPDTLRTLLIALLLPVAVWVVQALLQRVLGS